MHNAFLLEAPLTDLDEVVAAMQRAMAEASAVVLDGFSLRTEARVFRYPARYRDPRGKAMWAIVRQLLRDRMSSGSSQ